MPDIIQQRALRTWHTDATDIDKQRLHATLGLAGEAGEVAEQYKKHLFKPGRETNIEKRIDELVDVLYYLAILAHLDGYTFDQLSEVMVIKLSDGHGWEPDHTNR